MDMEPKYESEWYPSPCITHSNNGSQIGEFILCEALGENVSCFLCRWAILQGYHLIMHLSLDHAPSYECSACVSQCVFSSVSALDMWKYWLKFDFHTKLLWVNQMKLEVLKEYLATTHIVYLHSLLNLSRWKIYIVLFITWTTHGTMCKHEVDFLSMKFPTQLELVNPTNSSGELEA